MPVNSTRSQHPNRVAGDISTIVTSSLDEDGFPEVQLDAYGDNGSVQAQATGWYGLLVRPLDAEDGKPPCEAQRFSSGSVDLVFIAADPRVIPLLPPRQKGGVCLYDSVGSYVLFKPDDKTIEVHPASGGRVRVVVGNTVLEATDSGVSVTGDLTVSGQVRVNGEVTAMASGPGVKLSTHQHPTGVGPSGPPTPGT